MPQFQTATEVQEYYDEKLRPVGLRAPQPVFGESVNGYRRGFLDKGSQLLLQNHPLGKVEFNKLDGPALDVVEPQALDAFATERVNPARYSPGELKPIKVRDQVTGHIQETKWVGGRLPNGEQTCFTMGLGRTGRRVVSFSDPNTGRIYDATKGSWR